MLEIKLRETEAYDDRTSSFVVLPAAVMRFEHSLLSVSKWESQTNLPFLDKRQKTPEETYLYLQCMRTDDGPENLINRLSSSQIKQINDMIQAPSTATTFRETSTSRGSNEVITSEVMYYWIASYQLPIVCETWHLNRFMALVRIASIKNQPQKKMRRSEVLAANRSLNERRLAASGNGG